MCCGIAAQQAILRKGNKRYFKVGSSCRMLCKYLCYINGFIELISNLRKYFNKTYILLLLCAQPYLPLCIL